ncbi:RagB/SusD family nutrient uptake outer membrane protein [Spirosoma endophyticum]|uniref:SusD family protein n=1 Tax=Spirosoma endophyticum TaxID=662367 RepID=A0A1I1G1E9_9BACT|nr:RagB/SusD family nutrient uptake outer membrane protein [Spirosoma endophyticum]SFC03010.1 SusD family protein [Spirosoma endophyticum]
MSLKNNVFIISTFGLVLGLGSCTDLEEKFQGDLTANQIGTTTSANTAALLTGVYNSVREPFQNNSQLNALCEMTTDAMMGPTRGPDWDDNGTWRQLHQHRWDGNHIRIINTFNNMSGGVFAATDMLRFNPTPQQAAEARFIRAFCMFWLLDLYDQVPYREPGESVIQAAKVRKGLDALNYIISEVTTIQAALPDGPAGLANKDAARVFLMKLYLNKGAYANRATPTFAAEDMNKVISLADEIINSNKYQFTANYYDNFAPNNTTIGKENIWTQENVGGVSPNANLRNRWVTFLHPNQNPNGNNGWAMLPTFYDKYEATDKRLGTAYKSPGGLANPGNRINTGFLIGQQYNLTTDAPLKDRPGNNLIFSKDVKIIETGSNLELPGIRPIKYPIDYANDGSRLVDNDYVYFRLSDVLLMKAEAILRGGTATNTGTYGNSALSLVNAIRTHTSRGASALTSVNLDILLDERGRELYIENWRRQDLIRFGKFLQPFYEKNYTSDPKYLLFPIPIQQMAVNENYVQNAGY